jgi:hypothetical protein
VPSDSPGAPPTPDGTLSPPTSLLDGLLSAPRGVYLLGFALGTLIAVLPLLALCVMA